MPYAIEDIKADLLRMDADKDSETMFFVHVGSDPLSSRVIAACLTLQGAHKAIEHFKQLMGKANCFQIVPVSMFCNPEMKAIRDQIVKSPHIMTE